MSDIHIDDFFKDAAKVLLQLFNVFPRKSTVYVEDISGADNPDEFGLHDDRFMACFSTMLWLEEEGYIHGTTDYESARTHRFRRLHRIDGFAEREEWDIPLPVG